MKKIDWNQIVKEFGPLVWHNAYKFLGSHEDASDCFQLTFLEAVKYSKSGKIKNYGAFLSKLATSKAIDLLRKRKVRISQRIDEEFADVLVSSEQDPAKNMEAKELVDKLRDALAVLLPTEAKIFALKHFNNMSYKEIAKLLGIKKSNVGVILLRAKEKIVKNMQSENRMKKGNSYEL